MRLCTCGFANDDGRRTCLACGNVLPIAETEGRAGSVAGFSESRDPIDGEGGRGTVGSSRELCCDAPELSCKQGGGRALGLLDLRTNALIAVPAPGGVLGRAGDFEPDAFSPRVSGVHAVLTCDDEGRWAIEHVGRNGSSVERGGSWVPLRTGQPQPLFGGELLRLADMVFRVSVVDGAAEEACAGAELGAEGSDAQEEGPVSESASMPAEGEAPTSENAEEAAMVWSVRCPVCGTEHPVDGPQDRVAQCVFCQDPFDRVRIARTLPRRVPVPVQGE